MVPHNAMYMPMLDLHGLGCDRERVGTRMKKDRESKCHAIPYDLHNKGSNPTEILINEIIATTLNKDVP